MADDQLVQLFLTNPPGWRQWRTAHPEGGVDFRNVDLSGKQLPGAFLIGVNLYGANLAHGNLRGARFEGAYCHGATFDAADLTGANFLEAGLQQASFKAANLSGAVLVDATLIDTSFRGANLCNARLEKARLVATDLRDAVLTGARVYGISAWDVALENARQDNLVICRDIVPTANPSPSLVADSIELAQFLYLMLNNQKLRHIIEVVTAKVVLILGRFDFEHMQTLEALRASLRSRGYVPVLFDFARPANRDMTETVALLAHMSRFIIADISAPRSVPHELASLVPRLLSVPVQPLLMNGEEPYGMFADIQRYRQVLPIKRYTVPFGDDLLDAVIAASNRDTAR